MTEPLLAWLLTYLVHGTLLIGALWALDRRTVLRDPVRRERLWRAALVVPLFSATLQAAAPALMIPAPVSVAEFRPAVAETMPAERAAPAAIDAPRAAPTTSVVSPAPTSAIDPWQWLAGLWLVTAAWLLLRTGVSVVRGQRLLRDRRPVTGAAARELAALVRAAGTGPVKLTASAATPGPLTLPGREICVPERALALPADELRGMLAHELAHVVRGDAPVRLATTLLCAAFCVQPLNFLARRRLVECAELNADDWARGLLGDGHPLARCLVTVATWLEPSRAPVFAAAMAESDHGLLGRVRRLADAAPQFGGWRGRGALLGLLLLATLAAPGFVLHATERSVQVSEDDDGTFSIRVRDDHGLLRIRATGEVRFDEAAGTITSLEAGKLLHVMARDERGDGLLRELRVRAGDDGTLSYDYEVDGDARPFDAAGRAWFAGLLPQLYRASGLQAAERVARIHAAGGVDAVIDEIALIPSDFVSRIYFTELAKLGPLDSADRVRVYRLAGESIGSDFELRHALAAFPLGPQSSPAEASALLGAAEGIGSDFELAELLIDIADVLPADAGVREAFVAAARGIGSDFELARTLTAAIRAGVASGPGLGALLPLGREIGSDFELAGVLKHLFGADDLDAATVRHALTVAADEIGSDFELLQVLKAAAPSVRRHPDTRPLYEKAAESLGDHEYREAMRAL